MKNEEGEEMVDDEDIVCSTNGYREIYFQFNNPISLISGLLKKLIPQ